jgi:PAS domain S-box-containing protein
MSADDRDLADESPDALVASTPEDGRVVYWNRGAERMFGYTSAEALGRLLEDLIIPPERGAEQRAGIRQALALGAATYESVRRRKDGTLIYVDVSSRPVTDAAGNVELIVSSQKDVTQLKLRRDAKLIEARFRDLVEAMPDGIVMVNSTGRIMLANGQAERLFGYDAGELRGEPIELLLPARFRAVHVGHRAHYFAQPRNRSMGAGLDLYGIRKDGSEFPVEISLSPIQTEEGTIVSSAIRDITDRKIFERALQEKNVELANANAAKDRFLATMSHELRTPLNAIIGFTGTLLMRLPGPLTADQAKQLTTVQTSAKHLLALINDLLDLAKIEAGKIELDLEPTSCGDVVAEVLAALHPLAETKGLALRFDPSGDHVVVHTDRRALHQIVLNLVNNAIKFTDRGGIDVAVERLADAADEHIELRVADTGVGIRPEDQAKLFAAFSRVESKSNRALEGTGLGLHLSQKLAELLGGRITCRSEYGKGTTFIVRLPGGPA